MSVKLKPITEHSWLVISDVDQTRVGLLTQARDRYVLMAAGEKRQFLDRNEVSTYFNEQVFDNLIKTEQVQIKKTYYINGYPVDFDNPQEVIVKGVNLPLFSKKTSSEVYYCAGYYCLNFPKNWMPAYCPKLSTLESYEYAGPFKTELDMRTHLTKLRKDKK